ncbi:GRIA2-like protein, partial [Mya arenaria]
VQDVSLEHVSGFQSFSQVKGVSLKHVSGFQSFSQMKGVSLKHVGTWKHGFGFRELTLPFPSQNNKGKQNNGTLIITTIINPPFVQASRLEKGRPAVGEERFEGFCIDMIKVIAQKVNFNYTIREVLDREYGSKLNDGSWDGMVGEIIREEADIALASLTISSKREEVVYFTKPYMNTGISIMIKRPERDKPGVFSFMDPLSYAVWGCIIGGFFGVSLMLYMVGRFSPYEWQPDEGSGNVVAPSDTFSFINTLWFSLGALMQQGPDIFPRSLSGRVLASAWWFFTLITISSYTANLAAFLTFEKLTTPINSVDDLVTQSKIKYGSQGKGTTHDFFKDSKVPTYQTMHNVMEETVPSVYVESPDEGWKRVIRERGKYAFLLESANNNYFNQRKPCKTMKVGRNLDQKGYGIAMQNHLVNIAVLEMAERGDLLKLEQRWWYNKGECGNAEGGGVSVCYYGSSRLSVTMPRVEG